MDSQARYAIYLAPPPASALWRFGSRVLGYDAATGENIGGYAPVGIAADDWRIMTERPRAYGFHATLKAPFRLAPEMTVGSLEAELAAFAATAKPFDLGPLAAHAIGIGGGRGFAALTQTRPSSGLEELEAAVVSGFDRFRAPLSDEERRKRRPERLTERQRAALDRWGYPHVGPDYRFHMTLSGEVEGAEGIAAALGRALEGEVGPAAFMVDALALFAQDSPGDRFRILRRFAFGAS
jgi:2'-5' RNA ligase